TDPGRDFFAASVEKTLRAVFHEVRLHGTGDGNMFFAASDRPEMKLGAFPSLSTVASDCREQVATARESNWQTKPEDGIVLTDDYNPLEYYDAANRETIRRAL